MAAWDDGELDSDGEQLVDWLWDFPDRYDVGPLDEPDDPDLVGAGFGQAGLRKRVRRPDETETAAQPPWGREMPGGQPTVAMGPIERFSDDEEYEAALSPILVPHPRPNRDRARPVAAVAAVILAVAASMGIGYALFGNKKGAGPSRPTLAVGTATTAPVPTFDQGAVPPVITPVADTTTSSTTPTTTPPTSSTVPSAAAAVTTTTGVRHCATTMSAHLPADGTSSSTITTTTVAPSTTTTAATTTTVPATTTTVPATTTSWVPPPPPSTTLAPPPPTTAPHGPATTTCH